MPHIRMPWKVLGALSLIVICLIAETLYISFSIQRIKNQNTQILPHNPLINLTHQPFHFEFYPNPTLVFEHTTTQPTHTTLLEFKTLMIHLSILPLLHGTLKPASIEIDHLTLKTLDMPTAQNLVNAFEGLGLSIKHSTLKWHAYTLTDIEAKIPTIRRNAPMTLQLRGQLSTPTFKTIPIQFSSLFTYTSKEFRCDNTHLMTTLYGWNTQPLNIHSTFNFIWTPSYWTLKDFMLDALNLHLQGNLSYKHALGMRGTFSIPLFNLQETLGNLGYILPFSHTAFQAVALNVSLPQKGAVKFSGQIDHSTLKGHIDDAHQLKLDIDQLDLRTYQTKHQPRPQKPTAAWLERIQKNLPTYKVQFSINHPIQLASEQLSSTQGVLTLSSQLMSINAHAQLPYGGTLHYLHDWQYNTGNNIQKLTLKNTAFAPWISYYLNFPLTISGIGTLHLNWHCQTQNCTPRFTQASLLAPHALWTPPLITSATLHPSTSLKPQKVLAPISLSMLTAHLTQANTHTLHVQYQTYAQHQSVQGRLTLKPLSHQLSGTHQVALTAFHHQIQHVSGNLSHIYLSQTTTIDPLTQFSQTLLTFMHHTHLHWAH